MRAHHALVWLFAAAVFALGRPASGQTPSATTAAAPGRSLQYDAPLGCPAERDFSEQVAARTSVWDAPNEPIAVDVAVSPEGSGFVGRVELTRGEHRTLRELHAERCAELVPALALIVAILLDPHAATAAPEPEPEPKPRVAPERFEAFSFDDRPPPAPHRLWLVAGPELALSGGIGPDVAVGERLFFGVGRGTGMAWASSLRLSLTRSSSAGESPVSRAQATFELASARLDACVVRVAAETWGVELCPFGELGRLRAVGNHPLGPETSNEWWGQGGVLLRPSVTLAGRLMLVGGFGLALPFTRYAFAFKRESALYRTPGAALEASLGLGVRFP